jgi:hypothetical protein
VEIYARRAFLHDRDDWMLRLHKSRSARIERLASGLALLRGNLTHKRTGAALRMNQAVVEIAYLTACCSEFCSGLSITLERGCQVGFAPCDT